MTKQASEKKRAIESLVRLRQLASDRKHQSELEPVVSFLEDLVGPTVTRADSERSRALRQNSPFAGTLNEHERRRVARAVEERISA